MRLTITKAVNSVTQPWFEHLLDSGAFPEVKWEKSGYFKSYSMFEYSDVYSRYMKLVDKLVIDNGLDTKLGVFSRKHSVAFINQLRSIVHEITESAVNGHGSRFKNFADSIRGTDPETDWDTGDFVACDFCNEGEDTMGGVLIGSYAVCGDCAKKIEYPDEIDERFDVTKSFRRNVLEYRKRVYGTSECKVEVYAS